jgi:hypothetical protein
MAQYYHFTVLHSDIEVEFISNKENHNTLYHIWLTDALGTTTAAYAAGGTQGLTELQPHSTGMQISSGNIVPGSKVIRMHFDASKAFNKRQSELVGDTPYSGDASTSPAEGSYFEVGGYHPTGVSSMYTDVAVRYTITYYAVFTERKLMPPS